MYPERSETGHRKGHEGTRDWTGRDRRRTSRCVSQSSTPGARSCGKRPEIRNGPRNGPRDEGLGNGGGRESRDTEARAR